MTHSAVKIQIAPQSLPSIPSWFGEVAVVAEILTSSGLLHLIETKVQFARARFGDGDYRAELQHALQAVISYTTAFSFPLSSVIIRLDGLYGNTAPLQDLLAFHVSVIRHSREYHWLDLPEVQARLRFAPDAQDIHPESGTQRDLYDCPAVMLRPQGPVVRLIVAAHAASQHPHSVGTLRNGVVYELFYTILPPQAFTASDILHLYLHRGSFETVLSDEDQ